MKHSLHKHRLNRYVRLAVEEAKVVGCLLKVMCYARKGNPRLQSGLYMYVAAQCNPSLRPTIGTRHRGSACCACAGGMEGKDRHT